MNPFHFLKKTSKSLYPNDHARERKWGAPPRSRRGSRRGWSRRPGACSPVPWLPVPRSLVGGFLGLLQDLPHTMRQTSYLLLNPTILKFFLCKCSWFLTFGPRIHILDPKFRFAWFEYSNLDSAVNTQCQWLSHFWWSQKILTNSLLQAYRSTKTLRIRIRYANQLRIQNTQEQFFCKRLFHLPSGCSETC